MCKSLHFSARCTRTKMRHYPIKWLQLVSLCLYVGCRPFGRSIALSLHERVVDVLFNRRIWRQKLARAVGAGFALEGRKSRPVHLA